MQNAGYGIAGRHSVSTTGLDGDNVIVVTHVVESFPVTLRDGVLVEDGWLKALAARGYIVTKSE